MKKEVNIKEEINNRLKLARAAEDDLDSGRVIKAYYQTYPLYEALKEAEIIQIGTEHRPNYREVFARLADAATATVGNPLPHRQVIKRVRRLESETLLFLTILLTQ